MSIYIFKVKTVKNSGIPSAHVFYKSGRIQTDEEYKHIVLTKLLPKAFTRSICTKE
jgi:hypothetical protein